MAEVALLRPLEICVINLTFVFSQLSLAFYKPNYSRDCVHTETTPIRTNEHKGRLSPAATAARLRAQEKVDERGNNGFERFAVQNQELHFISERRQCGGVIMAVDAVIAHEPSCAS